MRLRACVMEVRLTTNREYYNDHRSWCFIVLWRRWEKLKVYAVRYDDGRCWAFWGLNSRRYWTIIRRREKA